MDLDTLIYIIVMIIFIALGAFGKRKKPVQQVSEPLPEGDEDILTPEDIIAQKLKSFIGDYDRQEPVSREPEILYEDYAKTPVQETYKTEPYQTPPENYSLPQTKPEEIIDTSKASGGFINEGASIFEHYNYDDDNDLSDGDLTKQEDPHGEGQLNDVFSEFSNGFDAKKAIIYSEIINRKQF